MPTTAYLVDKVFIFCETMAYGDHGGFFPFQAQFSKRIIRSFIENDGAEISGQQARQSGKSEVVAVTIAGCSIILPIMANMPMFVNDPRLVKYKNGMLTGLFAPTQLQSQIVFSRIKIYLSSNSAVAVTSDPDINVKFGTNNGQNFVLEFINLNITSTITCMSASEGSQIEGKSYMAIVVDESQDVGNNKYNKSIVPMGAFYNATKVIIGTPSTSVGFFYNAIERNKKDFALGKTKRNHFEYNWQTVAKYNPNYLKHIEGEKIRIGEDSDEFQMSYNLKWILERGMFITTEKLEKLGDKKRGLYDYDLSREHVVGIDFGKQSDSTIVTVGEVDWENPILIEKNKSDDPSVEDFIVYDVIVKAWLELQGDNWDTQYYDIKDFLGNFNIRRIVADATGVGAGIVDRIRANFSCEVWDYVFSTPSKSDLYKHYDMQLKAGRVSYPADEETQETKEYKNFIKQHQDLLKGYSGQNMVVCHPDGKEFHDDYTDSSALMVWGARGEGVSRPQTEKDNVFMKDKRNVNYYNQRNNVTARRR